jgi:hypothetical protein
MNRLLAGLGLATGLFMGAAAVAQDAGPNGPVVVELFTSQGCAACPPADQMIADLSGRDDVIALSLHVDYWNYLGWEDTFSQAIFTERQYGYGHAAGSTVVYTPQLIVGGQDRVMGARAMELADQIAAHRALPDPVSIEVGADGANAVFVIRARWMASEPAPDMVVQLVAYSPREVVEISRGLNAGRVAEYRNVVRQWIVVSEWDGAQPFTARVSPQTDLPHVVIVQGARHGAILGAARID